MTAFVTYTKSGKIEIRAPYNAAFVESLKLYISWDSRSWDGQTKLWTVDSYMAKRAIRIVEQFFENVEIIAFQGSANQSTGQAISEPFRVLHLLPTAPAPVIHAAYKALARLHHPDTGGNTHSMQLINSAYDQLKDKTT